jgi:hypothetical protein
MKDALNEFRKVDSAEGNQKIHAEALKRFAVLQDRERFSRALAIEDKIQLESEGGNWEDYENTSSDVRNGSSGSAPPPPRYHIDRVSPVLEQSLSDQRQNEIQIQVRGAHSSNAELEGTMSGLIKSVEARSDASYAYDNCFDETQKCGYGGYQIVTEWGDGFDQEILIRPIKDAASSLWFGESDLYTKEDALYAFVIWYMDKDEFKAQYPDSSLAEIPDDIWLQSGKMNADWYETDNHKVRMGAYWRKKPIKREIVMMTDGKTYEVDEAFEATQDELAAKGITIEMRDGEEMRREFDDYEIERYIINGAEILTGPQKWAGKYIPLIPEYGVQTTIQGREIIRGRVRKTRDAAMLYDYAQSAAVKQAAANVQDILMITAEQADGYEKDIEDLSLGDAAALLYNHIDGQAPPFRSQSRQLDMALMGISQAMAENIAATLGGSVGSGFDGTAVDGRSGEAILQGQQVSEKSNAIYMTNHIRSVSYGGKILADLLPRIKSQQAQARIINPDGSSEFVPINTSVVDLESGKSFILNDLSSSKYDIIPDVGPAYASKRQQASAQLQSLSEKNPAFGQRPDLIVKGLDLGDGGEMYESLRKGLVMSGAVEPTDEEREEFQIDEMEQIKQQLIPELMEQLMQDANVRLVNANAAALESQAQATMNSTQIDQMKADTDRFKAESSANAQSIKDITEMIKGFETQMKALKIQNEMGIELSAQDADNMQSQSEAIETTQQVVAPGPNSVQQEQFEKVVQGFTEPEPEEIRYSFNFETGALDENA